MKSLDEAELETLRSALLLADERYTANAAACAAIAEEKPGIDTAAHTLTAQFRDQARRARELYVALADAEEVTVKP